MKRSKTEQFDKQHMDQLDLEILHYKKIVENYEKVILQIIYQENIWQ